MQRVPRTKSYRCGARTPGFQNLDNHDDVTFSITSQYQLPRLNSCLESVILERSTSWSAGWVLRTRCQTKRLGVSFSHLASSLLEGGHSTHHTTSEQRAATISLVSKSHRPAELRMMRAKSVPSASSYRAARLRRLPGLKHWDASPAADAALLGPLARSGELPVPCRNDNILQGASREN